MHVHTNKGGDRTLYIPQTQNGKDNCGPAGGITYYQLLFAEFPRDCFEF